MEPGAVMATQPEKKTIGDKLRETERSMVAYLLNNPEHRPHIAKIYPPEWMISPHLKVLYSGLTDVGGVDALRIHLDGGSLKPPSGYRSWSIYITAVESLTVGCGESGPVVSVARSAARYRRQLEARSLLAQAEEAAKNSDEWGTDPEAALATIEAKIRDRRIAEAKSASPRETLADLLTADIPDLRWVVPGILPEGLVLLVGPPKKGKSWLALSWSMSVVMGGPAMGSGHRTATAGRVLYGALEDGRRRMKHRALALIESYRLDRADPRLADLTPIYSLPKLGGELEDYLGNFIDTNPTTTLVILDTVGRLRPQRKRSDGIYQADVEDLGRLQRLATDRRICVLGLHHNNRGEPEDWLNRVSGSQGFTGTADQILYLEGSRGTANAILRSTGRDLPDLAIALRFEAGAWYEVGDAAEQALSLERQTILQTLREAARAGTPHLSTAQLARALGRKDSAVSNLLRKLEEDGHIRTAGYGKWTIPLPF